MLLEAAQQGRQAGSAAERDDPRAAGQEALLVDDLDERPILVVRAEWVHQHADDAFHEAKAKTATPTVGQDQRPEPVRQELEGHRRDDRLERLAELDVAVELAQDEGAARRPGRARPGRRPTSQRLIPMPGVSQRRISVGDGAPERRSAIGSAPLELAMEDGDRRRSPARAARPASSSAIAIERW